jgi:hypothetical protein
MTRDLLGMPTEPSEEQLRRFGRSFKLRVIQEDTNGAKCGDPTKCVIVRAIRRERGLKPDEHCRVDSNAVTITSGDFIWSYHVTKSALQLVCNFDQIGEQRGEAAARAAMPRRVTFLMTYFKWRRKPPPRPARSPSTTVRAPRAPRTVGLARHNPRKRYVGI